MAVIEITAENFEAEVINSSTPVLVDFWATWCGPCKMVAPVIDALAEEYDGKVKVGKVDIDAQMPLTARFGVMSVPTIIIFKNGEIADKAIGARSKGDFEKMIDAVL